MKHGKLIKRHRNGHANHMPEPVPSQEASDEATDDQARQYGWDQASQLGARLPALRPALEDFARRLRQSITPSRRQQIQEQVAEAKEQEAILIRRNDTIRDTLVPKREDEIARELEPLVRTLRTQRVPVSESTLLIVMQMHAMMRPTEATNPENLNGGRYNAK